MRWEVESAKDLLSVDEWLDEIERVIGDTFEND
jgi:hypothetical protein